MTKDEFNAKYGRIPMPTPFAGGESGGFTPVADTSSDSPFNFAQGFASVYETPRTGGGKFVTRKQINAIGNLATHNDFYYHCGGLNEFDISFAEKVQGYPAGAVLDYLAGNKIFKIISLQDDNMHNPYGIAGNTVVAGLVDGIWWKYLNQDNAEGTEIFVGRCERQPVTTQLQYETPENEVHTAEFFESIMAFVVPKAGILYAKNIIYNHKFTSVNFNGTWTYNLAMGDGVIYKDLGVDPVGLENIEEPTILDSKGWNLLGGFGQGISGVTSDDDITTNWAAKASIPLVAVGHYVVIGLLFGCGGFKRASEGYVYRTTVGGGEDCTLPISFDLWIR